MPPPVHSSASDRYFTPCCRLPTLEYNLEPSWRNSHHWPSHSCRLLCTPVLQTGIELLAKGSQPWNTTQSLVGGTVTTGPATHAATCALQCFRQVLSLHCLLKGRGYEISVPSLVILNFFLYNPSCQWEFSFFYKVLYVGSGLSWVDLPVWNLQFLQ